MALTDIQKKIEGDAEAQVARILKGAHDKMLEIIESGDKEKEAYKEEMQREFSKQKENIERMTRAESEQITKNALAKAREEKIDEAFTIAHKHLVDLNDADYKAFIESKLKTINTDEVTVFETPKDRVATLKKLVKGDVVANDTITGGFIAHGENAHYDLSFEALITEAREKHMVTVAQKLF